MTYPAGELAAAVVAALVAEPAPASVTVVVPAWQVGTDSFDGRADAAAAAAVDPTWIEGLAVALREAGSRAPLPAVGVITGDRLSVLTRVVAKAVLADAIASGYGEQPVGMITDFSGPAIGVPFARIAAPAEAPARPADSAGGAPAPVLVDAASITDGSALGSVRRAWSAIVFRTHARHYCGLLGYLCGARPHDGDPEAPVSRCVLGMECYEPSWPQVDPRSYDAPVVVYDSCSTGSWSPELWGSGVPSLAVLALGGAPGAVVASAGPTVNPSDGFADPFAAIAATTTMGDAVVALNRLRPGAGIPPAYHLLGDPEVPTPRAATAVTVDATVPADAVDRTGGIALARLALDLGAAPGRLLRVPLGPGPWTGGPLPVVHLVADQEPADPAPGAGNGAAPDPADGSRDEVDPLPLGGWIGLLDLPDGPELWASSLAGAGRVVAEVWSPPPGNVALAEQARTVLAELPGWTGPAAESKERLTRAANAVAEAGRALAELRPGVQPVDPVQLARYAEYAVHEWQQAQLSAVVHVRHAADSGLWPLRFWSATPRSVARSEEPCAVCGGVPTMTRDYETAPGVWRRWVECELCADIVSDGPLGGEVPAIDLRTPPRIEAGTDAVAELEIDAAGCAAPLIGAGLLLVDMPVAKHGVHMEPELFPIRLRPGGRTVVRSTIRVGEALPVAHLFRIRMMILANGRWLWASRQLRLARPGGRPDER